jgi:hypothetical protein
VRLPGDDAGAGACGDVGLETPAQVGDVGLQAGKGVGRPIVLPEVVDQLLGADESSAVDHEHGEDGALPRAAEVERRAIVRRRELAEQADLESPTVWHLVLLSEGDPR